MNLARETLVNFVGKIVTSVAGFVATIVIARFLGAESLGIYSLSLALLFWLNIPVTGIQQSILKRVSEGTDRAEYFSAGFLVNAALTFFIGGFLILFQGEVAAYVGADVTPLLVVLLSANVLFGTAITGLNAQKRVGLTGIIRAFERISRTILQVVLILLSYTVGGLLVGHVFSLLLATGVTLWFYSFGLSRPSLYHFRDLVEYAKYAWMSNLEGKAYGWMDTIVLGFFVSASLIGIYEVAWSLASTLVLINKSILQSLFPEVSDLNEQDDFDKIREHISEALTFSGITMIPGFVGAVLLGPELLKIYSSEFTAGATVLLILIFARMVNSVGEMFNSLVFALDRPDIAFWMAVPVILSNLVLNLVLVSLIGWYGAAIATALTGVLHFSLSYGVLRHIIGAVNFPLVEIGRQVVASLAMGVAIWVLQTQLFINHNHYVTIGLVLVGAGIYGVVLFGISPRFRRKVASVVRSF